MINRFGSLDLASEKEFFSIEQFHSKLKANMISEEEYEAVKKLYLTMKMENLSEFNKLYSFQDAITLCKIFESRASFLSEKFKFNARKWNSASTFSGHVHRDKSKCCITLATSSKIIRLFEKTLIGWFSGVNTWLAFDSQILLPKNEREKSNMISLCTVKKKAKQLSQKFWRILKKF